MSAKKNNKSTGRRYDLEYARYQGRPDQIAKRSARNKARRKAAKTKGKAAIRGKDVHHKDGNPKNNKGSNLATISKSKNRSFRRSKTGKNLGLRKGK